jgi:transposase
MLTMTEIDDIREAYYAKGKTISAIAKEYGKDRKTVRKYILQEDFNVSRPTVKETTKQHKLDPYKETIDEWLKSDRRMRRKQRHTARRVYNRLAAMHEDFPCSYRTVAFYVKEKKKEIYGTTGSALPLVHKAGEAQVDFGSADFYENGTLCRGKYLNLTFPHSNAGYLQIFKGENRECLFEGLRTLFEYLGGVPHRLWFDNASVMVTAILKNGGRTLTDEFRCFKEHYGFEAVFCNPAAGNEKGSVENKVGYHRRNFLVPPPEVGDLREYNPKLLALCESDHRREHYRKEGHIALLHEEDKKALLALPSVPFDCSSYEHIRVDAWGKFHLTPHHTYSTAPKHARSRILVQITSDRVIPLDESHRPITVHQRLYGNTKQEAIDWIPYLTQLSRNPGALKYTGIWDMLPDPLKAYLDNLTKDNRKKALGVLAVLSEEDGFERAVASVGEAVSRGVTDLDSLLALHGYLNQGELCETLDLEGCDLPDLPAFSFSATSYDAMLGGKGAKQC